MTGCAIVVSRDGIRRMVPKMIFGVKCCSECKVEAECERRANEAAMSRSGRSEPAFAPIKIVRRNEHAPAVLSCVVKSVNQHCSGRFVPYDSSNNTLQTTMPNAHKKKRSRLTSYTQREPLSSVSEDASSLSTPKQKG